MNRTSMKMFSNVFPVRLTSLFLFLCIAGLLLFPLSTPSRGDDGKKVLLIHSYHRGYQWTDSLNKWIVKTITEERPSTDFYVEYMDTKRYYTHGFLFDLAMIYKQKYMSIDLDLVICTDDNAYKLMQYYGANLFPGVPVVFCGVNDPFLVQRQAIEIRTGLMQTPASIETVLLALEIQPETRNIALLYDSTGTALENRNNFFKKISELPEDLTIIEIPQMKEADLKYKLSSLPEQTVILLLGYWRSSEGIFYNPLSLLELIKGACDLPVYSMLGFMTEECGALGGKADFGYEHGTIAASMALKLLQGESVEKIPVIWEGPSKYVFNYDELIRFGIDPKDLPRDSIIFHRPENFFERYRQIIIINVIIILVLLFMAGYLYANVHSRKKAERELLKEKEFMEQLFENSPEGIVLIDSEDRIRRANKEMARLFKYRMKDMIGARINSIVAGNPEMMEEASRFSRRSLAGHEFMVETVRHRSDGTEFPVSICGMPFEVDGEMMVYGIYRDISERKRAEEKLKKRLKFEEFISKISSRMIFESNLENLLNESLENLCGIINAARGHIVFFENDHSQFNAISEWTFHYDNILTRDKWTSAVQDFRWMIDHLKEFGQIIAEDLDSFKAISEEDRILLTNDLDTSALIALPFYREEKLNGFIGIYDPWPEQVWNSQDINLLRTYRDIVGEAFLRKESEDKLQKSLESLKRTFEGTIDSVGKILEVRDPYTSGHQRRVAHLAVAIANELELEEDRITGLYYAALVHDIGKINVPSEILSKPDRLTPIEEALVKHHCNYGWEILEKVDFPWPVAEMVLQHHEHFDGSGYPRGLQGDEILIEARILTVADMVEAMSSDRPYRPALGLDMALENIIRFSGKLYDPRVSKICLSLFREKGFELRDK